MASPATRGGVMDQAVPGAAHGLDAAPSEGRVDLAAQGADVDLDDRGAAVVGVVPHLVEDVLLGDHLAAAARQAGEHRELARGQGDLLLTATATQRASVQPEIAGAHRPLRGTGLAAAPDQRTQPGEQHDEGEGFGQVVVCAGVEPIGLVVLAVLGGEHEDGRGHAALAQFRADPVAVDSRQHHIENDHLVRVLLGQLQAGQAVGDVLDRIALTAQSLPQGTADLRVVVDDQDVHGVKHPRWEIRPLEHP
ncbi:hypothetical protein SNOUR_01415 [Streptomyces noursei ATCC 11455]|nr:hypothetical protein SNOUR_01415 [Streptomyces noursei ATCC 11455]